MTQNQSTLLKAQLTVKFTGLLKVSDMAWPACRSIICISKNSPLTYQGGIKLPRENNVHRCRCSNFKEEEENAEFPFKILNDKISRISIN